MKLLALFITILFLSCAGLKPSSIPGRYYQVKSGDTLESISKKQKISIEEICEINGIENNSVQVGHELYLPDPDPITTKVVKLGTRSKQVVNHTKNLIFPVPGGTIFRKFSRSKENPYDGIGIRATRNTPVLAALEGRVLFVGDDGTKFGLLIILEHKNLITVYTHLEKAHVKHEQLVKQGETIATVGSSGHVSSPRLHFQVRVNERPEDPADLSNPPSKPLD